MDPQEGQTKGFWSRSAAIRMSASGARYSFTPRRPTVGPSRGVGGTELANPPFANVRKFSGPRKAPAHIAGRGLHGSACLGLIRMDASPGRRQLGRGAK